MDALEALLMPVPEDERMKALARSLRGRQVAADFFAGSTVPGLQRMAQGELEYIKDVAERQGFLREALERRKQDQSQHDAWIQLQRDNLEQRKAEMGENSRLRLAIEAMKGERAGSGGYSEPKTKGEREAFDKGGVEAALFNDLVSTFKPEYTASVPLMGNAENFLARKFEGIAPKELTEQAGWWADYKERAELVRRHELFGAALTKTEQAQWEAAMITPNDGPEFIAKKLETQRALANKIAELGAAKALQKNYDPAMVLMNYGDAVDVESLAARVADGSYFTDLAARQAAERSGAPVSTPPEDDLMRQAEEAIAAGADREAVMRRLDEMRRGKQ